MRSTVRNFTAIARNATIAIVYYAGHGIEFERTNYLIPIDAQLRSDVDIEDETLSLGRIMRMLGVGDPFATDHPRCLPRQSVCQHDATYVASRSINRGLAKIEPNFDTWLLSRPRLDRPPKMVTVRTVHSLSPC